MPSRHAEFPDIAFTENLQLALSELHQFKCTTETDDGTGGDILLISSQGEHPSTMKIVLVAGWDEQLGEISESEICMEIILEQSFDTKKIEHARDEGWVQVVNIAEKVAREHNVSTAFSFFPWEAPDPHQRFFLGQIGYNTKGYDDAVTTILLKKLGEV